MVRYGAGLLVLFAVLVGQVQCFGYGGASVFVGNITNETLARDFLDMYEAEAVEVSRQVELVNWAAETNISQDNNRILVEVSLMANQFTFNKSLEARQFNISLMSPEVKEKLMLIADISISAQTNLSKLERLKTISNKMSDIYSTAQVCLTNKPCLELEPGIEDVLRKSRDYDELLQIWKGWHDATGGQMKALYTEYIQLRNEAFVLAGYKDGADYYKDYYDPLDDSANDLIEEAARDLWAQVLPLYEQLHGYVREKLSGIYGSNKFPSTGHIPAHLLGNLWAQSWDNLIEEVLPYPNKTSFDVTQNMIQQNYTVKQMFETAENFFLSLGLEPMTDKFWNLSMIEKPTDGTKVVCHGSAWDMADTDDFRIKMCTDINHGDLMTVHHEMGHIEYFMQYNKQSILYRNGANPGFHEAVGDLMALSVQTPEHLHLLGLLEQVPHDIETDLNFLMLLALDRIAFLPFGYLIDLWRWEVYAGDTTSQNYNQRYWQLRCRYQGVSPPLARSESDFDPGAKYHVAAGTPYIRYFVSTILQFQFHKAACTAAGHKGPLHRCDIFNSTEAGDKIRAMLQVGSSRPWPEILKNMTGQDKMDAGPLLEYFSPLFDFLREKNKNNFGWDPQCPTWEPEKGDSSVLTNGNVDKCADNAGETTQTSLKYVLVVYLAYLVLRNCVV